MTSATGLLATAGEAPPLSVGHFGVDVRWHGREFILRAKVTQSMIW